MKHQTQIDAIHDFWFGTLGPQGQAQEGKGKLWFVKDKANDEAIRQNFGAIHALAQQGDLDTWLQEPRALVAYVVLLDQFSRNMFRGTPNMFASDPKALHATHLALEKKLDLQMGLHARVFLYMPLMHSESLEDQELCITCMETLRDDHTGDIYKQVDNNVIYAVKHRDIIARFGRFPHRNETLGRTSTAEETQFLTQPGSSF